MSARGASSIASEMPLLELVHDVHVRIPVHRDHDDSRPVDVFRLVHAELGGSMNRFEVAHRGVSVHTRRRGA